jgi:hypothetical protein
MTTCTRTRIFDNNTFHSSTILVWSRSFYLALPTIILVSIGLQTIFSSCSMKHFGYSWQLAPDAKLRFREIFMPLSDSVP